MAPALSLTRAVSGVSLQLMGAIIFALGLWIRFDEDFQKWVKGLGMQHYWTGIYILMFIGLIIMVVSFFGCCGVVTEARWMLKVS